jgi:hypothetical protein
LFGWFCEDQGRGMEDVYAGSGPACPAMWKESVGRGPAGIAKIVHDADSKGLPFFTIHRWVFPLLEEESREMIARFWQRRGLFVSVEEGVSFLCHPVEAVNG